LTTRSSRRSARAVSLARLHGYHQAHRLNRAGGRVKQDSTLWPGAPSSAARRRAEPAGRSSSAGHRSFLGIVAPPGFPMKTPMLCRSDPRSTPFGIEAVTVVRRAAIVAANSSFLSGNRKPDSRRGAYHYGHHCEIHGTPVSIARVRPGRRILPATEGGAAARGPWRDRSPRWRSPVMLCRPQSFFLQERDRVVAETKAPR
jgi:hypothetical protein